MFSIRTRHFHKHALAHAASLLAAAICAHAHAADSSVDVVIYGATPAGITAALAAARAGQDVVIIEPGRWVGGMVSGGLSLTDTGRRGPDVFGGLTAEFFRRVQEKEAERGICIGDCNTNYNLEPQVAEAVFEEMLAESSVRVERSLQLVGAERDGTTITRVQTARGAIAGAVFIDASYEGDLMKLAGIPYRFGREAKLVAAAGDAPGLALQEDHAGMTAYSVPLNVYLDPYKVPGDPASGTLEYIEPRPDPLVTPGTADERVMAYIYRLCITDDPANLVPFEAPEGYDPADYDVHARLALEAPADVDVPRSMFNPNPIVVSPFDAQYRKYDLNGTFTFSTDLTGPTLNQVYVEAPEEQRAQIRRANRRYIEGLLYSWKTDPRFGALNEQVGKFGLCADEFTDNGNWPTQYYVRVGRRMIGEYVMNENDVLQNGRRAPIEDVVAYGTYAMGTHAHQYLAAPMQWPDGETKDTVVLEGVVIIGIPGNVPYPIPYRSLVPREEDARNFLNPVTPSSTNLAFSTIRMEPTLMMLGEAAGIAAALSIEGNTSVQNISYASLREQLEANGQSLARPE